MTIDFNALKNNRKSSFDKLTAEVNKLNQPGQYSKDNDLYWKPEVDKAGNGYAIIRFLPPPAGEDIPFVRIWDHGFQGPGGWFIEKSLTTFGPGTLDPVSEYNSQLWNSGLESNKEIARKQKRRLSYYSNIYVVSDPNRPENEGKVFLYKYGKKIYEKLNEAMHPPFDEQGRSPEHPQYAPNSFNPFDLWEGANFKLKIRKLDGYQNYDKSEFDKSGALFDDDEKLEALWKTEHSLQELLDPKNFKTYGELKIRLEKALGISVSASSNPMKEQEESFAPSHKSASMADIPKANAPWNNADDDDDEDLSFFKKLAKQG
jgi:hypothetical protein